VLGRLLALLAALALVAGCGGDDDESTTGGPLADAVAAQLKYLDPQSSAVVAIDLRWNGENWDDLRPVVDRVLKAYRESRPLGERQAIPDNAEDGLEQLVGFAKLSFANDVEPALDGHLVIGIKVPPNSGDPDTGARPHFTAVYRTEEGELAEIAERVYGEKPEPMPGYDDTTVIGDDVALVGGKTVVLATSNNTVRGHELRAALDRAKAAGRGFPKEELAQAEDDAGIEEPFLLATGDLSLGNLLVREENLGRARESLPYLRALTRGSVAVDAGEDAIEAKARLVTDGGTLTERSLPVGPSGEIELPDVDDAVAGASRNQSYTTTFGMTLARRFFPGSRFVKAVERAESELGILFEDEVLRQFDCPSVSILEPPPDGDGASRFGARSCVNDPQRMRELLPKLRPFLPDILTGLQGLGDDGLGVLLLLAPDAPLTPGGVLGQIEIQPFPGGGADDELYEITGLRENTESETAQAGPDKIVFGLMGDAFIVASDEEMARRAAGVKTEKLDREAGSALRVPVGNLLERLREDEEAQAFAEVFGDLVATVSAEPRATTAEARLSLRE
jgi:hypothetical protein